MKRWAVPSSFPCLLVSDSGDVVRMASSRRVSQTKWKTLPEKQLTPCAAGSGYLCVYTKMHGIRKTAYIHRLVAEAFLNAPNGSAEVNHIDGDKTNNHLSNLEWITHSDNLRHAYKSQLAKCKISPTQVLQIRQMIANGAKLSEIAQLYKVQYQTIRAIKTGKSWAWLDVVPSLTPASWGQ